MSESISGDKNPVVALILNLCLGWIGIGYFYMGQWQKGVACILLFVVVNVIFVIPVVGWMIGGVIGVIRFAVYIAIIIDAFMQAQVMKDGGAVAHWTFFNQKFGQQKFG